QGCYQAASPALARLLRDDIVATWARDLPSAIACLDDDFEGCIAHLRFPLAHRRAIRTTNLLERLFGEERRRTKVIPHAFGDRAGGRINRPDLFIQQAPDLTADQYELFLKTTNEEEKELVRRFMDKKTSGEYMAAAYKFGDLIFEALTLIGGGNRFHRLLVV